MEKPTEVEFCGIKIVADPRLPDDLVVLAEPATYEATMTQVVETRLSNFLGRSIRIW